MVRTRFTFQPSLGVKAQVYGPRVDVARRQLRANLGDPITSSRIVVTGQRHYLLRQTGEARHAAGETTLDLFADFNGIPKGVDKTEFYQHDQNWSNRMILGDSLQVMASLAKREGLRGKVQCIYLDRRTGSSSTATSSGARPAAT